MVGSNLFKISSNYFKMSEQEDDPVPDKSMKMSNALNKILDSSFKTKPILSLNKEIEKSLNNHKLEQKALKILLASKKVKIQFKRTPGIDGNEKTLRKIATRGVVQLFNAIKSSQKVKKETVVEPQNPVWMSRGEEGVTKKSVEESWDSVMEETAPL